MVDFRRGRKEELPHEIARCIPQRKAIIPPTKTKKTVMTFANKIKPSYKLPVSIHITIKIKVGRAAKHNTVINLFFICLRMVISLNKSVSIVVGVITACRSVFYRYHTVI